MTTPRPGAAPTRSRWRVLVWVVPAAVVVAVLIVLLARWLRTTDAVQSFLTTYPGSSELPVGTPVGFPAWLGWQHFLSAFFLLFIVRTGFVIRERKRPSSFWVRKNTVLKTRRAPVRIGMPLWLHLTADALWAVNGILFWVLLFTTGQWARIVPVHWDVFPNAVSAGLQYASLDWPVAEGWTNYNGLQLLTYFITVFIAAPLAVLTGLRLTPGLAARLRPLDRVVPLAATRTVHVGVMIWFVAFTIVHVFLVLATGALRNLNHMYAGRDDESWVGLIVFAGSVAVMVVAWVVLRPSVVNALAALTGTVRK